MARIARECSSALASVVLQAFQVGRQVAHALAPPLQCRAGDVQRGGSALVGMQGQIPLHLRLVVGKRPAIPPWLGIGVGCR